ncbi:MAG TPA: tetratricopeptide repeat protein, partial [Vineibacter sp.]|nr:tetratricopeptide repeat protein [Vineibacter sp.]
MRALLLSAAMLAATVSFAPAQTPHADPARQYANCMSLARSEPRRAIELAAAWEKAGGGTGARHCRAIALFGLGSHVEAGQMLEALGREMTGQTPALRAEVFAQAGQAYQAARLGEQALAAQNAAILLDPRNAEIWIDRSITYAGVGDWRAAISDLTRALQLKPGRVDALVMRAAARRQSNDAKGAVADADAAVRADANNTEALLERGLARRAAGDRAGSDTDLRRL